MPRDTSMEQTNCSRFQRSLMLIAKVGTELEFSIGYPSVAKLSAMLTVGFNFLISVPLRVITRKPV